VSVLDWRGDPWPRRGHRPPGSRRTATDEDSVMTESCRKTRLICLTTLHTRRRGVQHGTIHQARRPANCNIRFPSSTLSVSVNVNRSVSFAMRYLLSRSFNFYMMYFSFTSYYEIRWWNDIYNYIIAKPVMRCLCWQNEKRKVFRSRNVADLAGSPGNELQAAGPAAEKARRPNSELTAFT